MGKLKQIFIPDNYEIQVIISPAGPHLTAGT